MANAALERNISIQYCLPSATDMLASLAYPAVIQARASGDYARPEGDMSKWSNVATLGGASLLLGATQMAPSKDTLWTKSPQPPTTSDRTTSGYKTQPHVELDSILATLSLGPVGISDGLNETDAQLISQAFVSPSDSSLLRPSRPLSTADAVFTNKGLSESQEPSLHICKDYGSCQANSAADIRSTHAALKGGGHNSHCILAWMTTEDVTLQKYDLYPKPKPGTMLAVRKHVVRGDQSAGCQDGKPAASCVNLYAADQMPVIAAVGGQITDYSLTVIHEPASNGAYFLGELNNFVHVSPQRFESVVVKGHSPCGLAVTLKGTAGSSIQFQGVH